MKGTVTWVLVADHQHVRVFANTGVGKGLHEVPELRGDTHLHRSGEIMADRPGRSFESGDATRHAMERPSDPHRLEGQRFLAEALERLGRAYEERAFARLILIAPPRALGELRAGLPEALREVVIGEIDRDLVQQTPERIAEHAGRFLAV